MFAYLAFVGQKGGQQNSGRPFKEPHKIVLEEQPQTHVLMGEYSIPVLEMLSLSI